MHPLIWIVAAKLRDRKGSQAMLPTRSMPGCHQEVDDQVVSFTMSSLIGIEPAR